MSHRLYTPNSVDNTMDPRGLIDGACSNNGNLDAWVGIVDGSQTSQCTEICAAIAAVRLAHQFFLNGEFWGAGHVKGIILMTNSAYLVSAMTDWVYKWKRNGWKTSIRKPVVNMEDFIELDVLVQYLEQNCVPVRFWCIDREHNTFVDALVKAATGL
ncbi:ribonuclease H-like protein [Macrolepiota fuliginosa MF-IS2]|uniref:ribonuclease H n=1 Tax=Macrolepiota fuliginosa MF-IS2 TaxID=1400762 RepID=A0A9P6BY51_9AGAR|nr:ribonuclease H-like protein [Macrolepiota fuliginosa MF-IS2]